jgi:hypothetical protein
MAAISGCSEPRIPVFPVSGKVSFQGKPPVGAQVILHRTDTAPENDVTPVGIVQVDGSFKVSAYDVGDGAPQGEYVATVEWFKIVENPGGGGGRGPNVIPAKYASSKTSPVKVSVNGGPTEIPPITIQ